MNLFDTLIGRLPQIAGASEPKIYTCCPERAWPENANFELLLQKDTAYELGAGGRPSVGCTFVTSDRELLREDRITVYGRDLQEIRGESAYARVALVLVKEEPEEECAAGKEHGNIGATEKLYRMLQDIDFVKYHVFPKGYMVRNSMQTHQEQVRVGKRELAAGMTFEAIGNTYIRHYKENPNVLAAQIIFFTAEDVEYAELAGDAERTARIRRSLSGISKGMPAECSICGIREICNEVKGLRELHFGELRASDAVSNGGADKLSQ